MVPDDPIYDDCFLVVWTLPHGSTVEIEKPTLEEAIQLSDKLRATFPLHVVEVSYKTCINFERNY